MLDSSDMRPLRQYEREYINSDNIQFYFEIKVNLIKKIVFLKFLFRFNDHYPGRQEIVKAPVQKMKLFPSET